MDEPGGHVLSGITQTQGDKDCNDVTAMWNQAAQNRMVGAG
jgi:hypothetical protein